MVLAAILLAIPIAAFPAQAKGTPVSVLVDFGDGTYLWADVTLPVDNTTALKATEIANASWGLPSLEVRWFPFGAFVEDIGDRNPVYPEWWHFFLWNATASAWDAPSLGAADVHLADGDAIAWYLAVDDPITNEAPRPVPTPDFRDVWTSFRGDLLNTGRARGAIPVTDHLLWDRDVGVLEIDTTPVVAYGNVYVATRNALVALDAETGQEVWRNPRVRSLLSTPAVYDGHLVLGGTDGKLHYVNAFNGTEEWSLLIEPGANSTGIASSPAVHQGRAYVGTFNESAGGRGRVVSVNLNNGTVAWAYDSPGAIHLSQPAVFGGNLYVGIMGTYDGAVGYAGPFGVLSLTEQGAFRWFFETNDSVASSPAVRNGMVFVPTLEGWVFGLTETGREIWAAWTAPSTSSPALVDDRLFVGTGQLDGPGWIFGLNDIGEKLWWNGATGGFQASLVSDGRLVCGATNEATGSIRCFGAADGGLEWTYTPVPHQYILGSPAVAGDTLYAPSDNGHVYAFRDATPGEIPLLSVEINAPTTIRANQGFDVELWVRNLFHGRARDVVLTVILPAGLRTSNEPEANATVSRTLGYTVGTLGPDEAWGNSFGASLLPGYGSVTITGSLQYRDEAGREYPAVARALTVTVLVNAPPPTPWAPIITVLLVAAVAVSAVLLFLRRRGREVRPNG